MVASALALAITLCAALAWFKASRVELLHLAFFNHCSMHAFQYHWQDARRLRETFYYDFTLSPESFVMAEVWVIDGPVLKFSRAVPLECGAAAT